MKFPKGGTQVEIGLAEAFVREISRVKESGLHIRITSQRRSGTGRDFFTMEWEQLKQMMAVPILRDLASPENARLQLGSANLHRGHSIEVSSRKACKKL
jgi:hypothetical protein